MGHEMAGKYVNIHGLNGAGTISSFAVVTLSCAELMFLQRGTCHDEQQRPHFHILPYLMYHIRNSLMRQFSMNLRCKH